MGKSSGKAKTPYEAPDNLKSRQQLSIIDLIGEGQIEGPANGLQSIFLNDTPIQGVDGSYNFNGVEVEWTSKFGLTDEQVDDMFIQGAEIKA